MSVSTRPWKKPREWMVTIRIKWPSGRKLRDRKVVSNMTERQAERWGQDRERELLTAGEQKLQDAKKEAVLASTAISVADWYSTFYGHAERGEVGQKNRGKGQTAIKDRRDRFKNWIEPLIGHLMMRDVTSDHLRTLVRGLDDQIRVRVRWYEEEDEEGDGKTKPGISSKTGQHIWSEVTSGFKEALSSKIDELRVVSANPCIGVQPPIRTQDREQEALFPSEVVDLLSCEDVPLARRRLYAVAIYTGMRRSELARFTAAQVNIAHHTITVIGKKTQAATRQVPIEPALLPLLQVLVRERPDGPLLDVPKDHTARTMREDLDRAEITRAALKQDDAHVMPFNFHGTRHTCITHWAVSGRSQLFLLTVAGHMDVHMTRRYLGKAASVSSLFGQPHPALPSSLLGGAEVIPLKRKTAS